MQKTLMILVAFFTFACGSDSDYLLSNQCKLSLTFDKKENNLDNERQTLNYRAETMEDCRRFFINNSGDLYYRVEASGPQSLGYLSSINFGVDRTKSFLEADKNLSMINGAVSKEETYIARDFEADNSSWILPWGDVPYYFYVSFVYPSDVPSYKYPMRVEVEFKVAK